MLQSKLLIMGVLLAVSLSFVKGQQVSTKLDLDDNSKEDSNSKSHHSRANSSNSSGNSRVSPKIEGVRVTVDTGDKKQAKETESDKESVELVDNKNTKRVGIHTDITFEITDDKMESNGTSSEQAEKDNDASVPIFKGRGRDSHRSHHTPRRPYNPKIHIEYPAGPPVYTSGRDHYNNGQNIPVFPGTSDDGVYRNIDRWANVIPIMNSWTTERSSYYVPSRSHQRSDVDYRNYQTNYDYPSQHQQQQQPQYYTGYQQSNTGNGQEWKPCVCLYDSEWTDINGLKTRNFRSTLGAKPVTAVNQKNDQTKKVVIRK